MSKPSKPPRHNLAAERAVLGALLIDNAAYPVVSGIVRPSMFYRVAHQWIAESLYRLCEAGAVADLVTVAGALGPRLEEVGAGYLGGLVDGIPHAAHVRHYAEMVRDEAERRRLAALGAELTARAESDEDGPSQVVAWAERALFAGEGLRSLAAPISLSASADALYADLDRRVARKGAITGVPSGFGSLDALTLGWQPGEYVIIAARPSMGKSAFAMNCAVAAAQAGHRVLFCSLEMRRQALEYRILSGVSGVPLTRLLNGQINGSEWDRLREAGEIVHGLPLLIDDGRGRTARDIRRLCRDVHADGGLGLVVVDYVQITGSMVERKSANRNEELTHTSRAFQDLFGELGIPGLVLSQVNRDSDKADRRPRLADLRESGSLEQDCDIGLILHRKSHRDGGYTECVVEKQRNGPTGTVGLTLERECVRFVDGGMPEPEAAPARPTKAARPWWTK